MQLARDVILSAALIVLLVVYWIMNKRNLLSRKGTPPIGGGDGALRRLFGGRGASTANPMGRIGETVGSEYERAQVLAVLDDLYHEFRDEIEAVHKELDDLKSSWEKEKSELGSRLSRLEESEMKLETVEVIQDFDLWTGGPEESEVNEEAPQDRPGDRPETHADVVLKPEPERSATFDIRYLEVLDRLSEGEKLSSIAMELELDVEDVLMVQRIMSTPPSEVQ